MKLFYITTLSAILLGGCANISYTEATRMEVIPSSSVVMEDLKSHSLMQQILDAADRDGISMIFSVNSSDRYVPNLSEGNIFEVLSDLPSEVGSSLSIKSEGRFKKSTIKPETSSIYRFWEQIGSFSASQSIKGNQPVGAIKIVPSYRISGKVESIAKEYDSNIKANGGSAPSLYSFASYLSSEFAASNVKIYFNYDKKNKLLRISDTELGIESTPYRIFSFKKNLTAQGISFKPYGDTGVIVEGGFEEWAKAYLIGEELDPYKSQIYRISGTFGSIVIPEGYDRDRRFNIEFEGWNKNGTRSYMYYDNNGIKKITTEERRVVFINNNEKIAIDLY